MTVKQVRKSVDELRKLADWVQTEREKIRRDPELSEEGRKERLAEVTTKARRSAEEIGRETAASRTAAEAAITKALRSGKDDPTAALVTQSAQRQAWERAKGLLDAGASPRELIERAGKAGDVHALRALRAELPTYLETLAATAAGDSTRVADRTGRRERGRERADALMRLIDGAEAPHLPRAQRDALGEKYELEALDEAAKSNQRLVFDVTEGRPIGQSLMRSAYAQAEVQANPVGAAAGGGDA